MEKKITRQRSPHPFLCKNMNIPKVEPLRYIPKVEPLRYIPLSDMLHVPDLLEPSPYKLACSIYANVLDTTDRVIVDACIKYAEREGISDLYLLDREFVKAALLEKAERVKNAGRYCKCCGQKLED